jgi:hypothetical protein
MAGLSNDEVKHQSISCYNQWCVQWREQAKYHGDRFTMHDLNELNNSGVGKAALCIANGYSFEENIETIKKYQHMVDIVACDKTIKHCIDNGIKVKYCVVCDANVSYEKYLEPVKDKLEDTILLINVCAQTQWATYGNWKKIYFFVNQDVLGSEKEFMNLSGCPNLFVAATNVSGQMVVALTQSDNKEIRNIFGYDKILLIGFDYCWGDHYYAFDQTGDGKHNYMRNIYLKNFLGEFVYTSTNLMFSMRWLDSYIKTFKLPVFQCSKRGILTGLGIKDLATEMQYNYRPDDSHLVKKLVKMKQDYLNYIKEIDHKLGNIAYDHMLAVNAF